ncbi:MAG: hypothetical protein GY937_16625 [bacterium]|nr:hypothetical protein [bacterium]
MDASQVWSRRPDAEGPKELEELLVGRKLEVLAPSGAELPHRRSSSATLKERHSDCSALTVVYEFRQRVVAGDWIGRDEVKTSMGHALAELVTQLLHAAKKRNRGRSNLRGIRQRLSGQSAGLVNMELHLKVVEGKQVAELSALWLSVFDYNVVEPRNVGDVKSDSRDGAIAV